MINEKLRTKNIQAEFISTLKERLQIVEAERDKLKAENLRIKSQPLNYNAELFVQD